MIALSILFGALAAILLLPVLSDLVSIVVAAARRRPVRAAPADAAATREPLFLFLVPAHDEELLVANTVRSLLAIDYPAARRRVVVVADNCTDGTAQAARDAGAEVLERFDASRRGKPYALAWAFDQLRESAFDALVVMDADAIVDAGFARALAAAGPVGYRAAQSYNDVRNRDDNALTRMAAVFSHVRSALMNGLKQRAGLTIPMANGLCLGREVVRRHGWPAFSICEDWEMYVVLTALGVPIDNVPTARAFAQETRSLDQSASQRRRWAAGKIAVLLERLPALLATRGVSWRQKLDVAAELTSVGPAVHAAVVVLAVAVLLLAGAPGAVVLSFLLSLSLARTALYTLLALRADREPLRTALSFAFLPAYMVWRIVVQLGALRMVGKTSWVRTARHAASDAPAA